MEIDGPQPSDVAVNLFDQELLLTGKDFEASDINDHICSNLC